MVKKIEDYTILQLIGGGSYGEVYKATHQFKQGYFAIKVINNKRLEENPKVQQCLVNEVKVLSKMGCCQNIVEFYELIRSKNNNYFVYEYCNGGTLEQKLKEKENLTQDQAMKLFKEIINAFKVLNKYKVMHRDLKPQNILFHNGVLKLGDFGLCKDLKPEQDLTKTMLGTPIYMAPQILKNESYNSKADIWSLGVILYEMMYGFCPFQTSSIASLVNKIDNNVVNFPQKPEVSSEIKSLLKRMLTKDYFRRISWVQLFKEFPTHDEVKGRVDIKKTSRSNINIPQRTSLFESTERLSFPISATNSRLQKENKYKFSSAKYMEYLATNIDKPEFEQLEKKKQKYEMPYCEKWYDSLIQIHKRFEELSRTIEKSLQTKEIKILQFLPQILKLLKDKLTIISYNINQNDNGHRYNNIKKTIKEQVAEIDKNTYMIKAYLSQNGHMARPLKQMNSCVLPIQFQISIRQLKAIK